MLQWDGVKQRKRRDRTQTSNRKAALQKKAPEMLAFCKEDRSTNLWLIT